MAIPIVTVSAVLGPPNQVNATMVTEVVQGVLQTQGITATLLAQQGPAGPPGPTGAPYITRINNEVVTIHKGQPVKLNGATGYKLAQADVDANVAVGLAASDCNPGNLGEILLADLLDNGDWTAATGGSATLTPDAPYYTSISAPGIMTTVPSIGTGQVWQYLGFASTPTEFYIKISLPIIA